MKQILKRVRTIHVNSLINVEKCNVREKKIWNRLIFIKIDGKYMPKFNLCNNELVSRMNFNWPRTLHKVLTIHSCIS